MRVGPLKLKLQLVCGAHFAIGPGKAMVLEAIDREGSIRAAGKALGMSYRRTWLLVDEMNRCFTDRLVETLTGGGRERGARLTAMGRDVLKAFRELEAESAKVSELPAFARLSALIRAEPLEPPPAQSSR
ncbi:MAG: LysR family transcriptional regulator [Novosphingobium sp.]